MSTQVACESIAQRDVVRIDRLAGRRLPISEIGLQARLRGFCRSKLAGRLIDIEHRDTCEVERCAAVTRTAR